MRLSKTFVKTLREAPKDELAKNGALLTRAGYVHKEMAGVYAYLPLGLRVLENIKNIIRDELNKIGGEEILMTVLQNPEPWQKSGRWHSEKMDIWFKTELSAGGELGLAPTHEEPITNMLKNYVKSYKDLPIYPYQFQTKFRNELRAKSGILRGREFFMKDLYSFSATEKDLNDFYAKVEIAYKNIFDRLGIGNDTYEAFASGGVFSKYSHEFQTITEVGEDTVWFNDDKTVALNDEVMNDEVLAEFKLKREDLHPEKACEVGNIFKLKFKYSEPLDLSFTDENNDKKTVYMGCYGIGVSRVMGVIVEKFADEKGLFWPENLAPYKYYLVGIGEEGTKLAEKFYETHKNDTIFDDRDLRPGEKFADSELMGIPYRIVISDKTLKDNEFELTERQTSETKRLPLDNLSLFR